MGNKSDSMRMILCAVVLASIFATSATAQDVNSRRVACPSDPTVTGYTSIEDINQDQLDELKKIREGTVTPKTLYSFVLCPKTVFDTSETTFNIVLSGSVFSCGSDIRPSSALDCSIRGGTSQVFMADLALPNYKLETATMIGLTFEHFNGTAFDIQATEVLTLTLMDIVWKNFYSDFVIVQRRGTDGTLPARVDVIGGSLGNGFGGSLFSNDGGVLAMERLAVSNVTCAGLVATSNGGVTMIQTSSVSRSTIDTVGSATVGSTLSLFDVDVFDMVYTYTAFHVKNPGSMLILNSTKFRYFSQKSIWNGVMADDSATAILDRTDFKANQNFENLIHARASSTVEIMDSSFEDNVGLAPATVSNVIFVFLESVVNLRRSKFDGNTKLTALAFAYMQSTILMEHTCFLGGSSDQVAFASSDSAILPKLNYVADSFTSSTCPGGGLRLSMEQPGSQCYQESGSCDKTCILLADQTNCLANTARFSPLGRNGTDTNATGTAAPTVGGTPLATAATAVPGNGTTVAPTSGGNTTTTSGNTTTTVTPTTTGNGTKPPLNDGEPTVPPADGDSTVRIFVAWLVRNDEMITASQDVIDAGLADSFPVFVAQVAGNLSATGTRKLNEYQRRHLEVLLVEDSAVVYDVIPVGCVYENRTTNMTTSNFTTCHEAMGMYDLILTPDEDPVAVRTTYTIATRDAIDDGTFQNVLLELTPDSPLLLGPSIDARPPNETLVPPAGPPSALFPTILPKPTCLPVGTSKSKSKGGKGSKGKRGNPKMMRPSSKGGYRRNLNDHLDTLEPKKSQIHFENVLKDHDKGGYYTIEQDDTETEEEVNVDVEVDECEEPEYVSSKGKGGKGGNHHGEASGELVQHHKGNKVHSYDRYLNSHDEQRHLRDDLPRVHGANRRNHRISDIHAAVEAELQTSEQQKETGL